MDNKAVEDFMIESAEARGEARGMQIGKTEEKIAIARNLKKANVSITIISESTGLTKKQIEELDD